MGTVESGQVALLAVFLFSSILNAAYFLPIVYKAYFKEPSADLAQVKEAPPCCLIPLCLTAFFSVALFFYPKLLLELAGLIAGVTF